MFPETVDDFRTKLKPAFGLPAHSGNRVVVIIGISGRMAFVVQNLLNRILQIGFILGGNPGKYDIGQIVFIHVGKIIVRNIRAAVRMRLFRRRGDGAAGITVVGQQQHGSRRRFPVVVGVVHIALNGFKGVAADFRGRHHPRADSLLIAENAQGISPSDKIRIIGNNNNVFHIFHGPLFCLSGRGTGVESAFRQHVMVQD